MLPQIKVEQALHGYSRGHRELACSLALDRNSQAQMLAFSDLLVSAVGGPNTSYLTAYPLKRAKRFVLARTWQAGQSLRPGSVWTHSLILELSALTVIADLAALTSLFRCPDGENFIDYDASLDFRSDDNSSASDQWNAGADPRARVALEQLYGNVPADTIMLPSDGVHDGDLAIALWRQMWPAMRRDFAFVGGPVKRLTNFDASCTLFFNQGGPDLSNGRDVNSQLDQGIELLCQDLSAKGPTELRSFVGRYAIEAREPRTLVLPLTIHLADDARLTVREKLRSINDLGEISRLPRLVSDTIANGLVNADYVDDVVALLETYRDAPAPKGIGDGAGSLAHRKGMDLPRLLYAARPSEEGQFGHFLFTSLVSAASPKQLIDAADRGIDREQLLDLRPELWELAPFWPTDDAARAALVQHMGRQLSLTKALAMFPGEVGPQMLAILLEDNDKSPDVLLELLGRLEARALEAGADYVVADPAWIKALSQHTSAFQSGVSEALCNALIRKGGMSGEAEPWITVAQAGMQSKPSVNRSVMLVAFVAALGVPADRSLKVAKQIYDPLIKAAQSYQFSGEQEQFVLQALPASARRRNLRKSLAAAIVSKWHSNTISPQALDLTSDREALEDIVAELVEKFGHLKVEAIIAEQDIAPATRENLRRVYRPKPKKKKQSIWWWDW
jgi:hypothetical protein